MSDKFKRSNGGRRLVLRQRQVLFLFLLGGVFLASSELPSYSVAEKKERGSLVANIAKDLGLGEQELITRGARVILDDNK